MITVNILCSTHLLEITGERRNSIQVTDGSTVKELLNTLSERYGSKFGRVVLDENPYILIVVNGRSIHKYGLETKLKDGDSIVMSTLVSGG